MSVIEVEGLQKSFGRLQVLKDISFRVEQGDCVAIIGPSGSGKSTLLRCLIELETADGGSIRIHGQPLVERGIYAPAAKTRPIIARMGMVFQQFNLYPHLNVVDNLELAPKLVKGLRGAELRGRSLELLRKVGLAEKASSFPGQLSGGQQQRVAIARALIARPPLLLADEPTGNLDRRSGQEVMGLFAELHRQGSTIVLITHDLNVAKQAGRRLAIWDGRLSELDSQDGPRLEKQLETVYNSGNGALYTRNGG